MRNTGPALRLLGAIAVAALGSTQATGSALLPAIPPQPLDKALYQLARSSDLQLAYVTNVTSGVYTHGCPAGLSPVEALTRLLEGTGLDLQFINERTVRIQHRAYAEPLVSTAAVEKRAPAAAPAIDMRSSMPEQEEILVVGSRWPTARTNVVTPVPVDIISGANLTRTGQTDLNQMMSFAVPSFNSSRQTIADGTDHIDPATLRGLGPDQMLVLVNGKRQHTTALVNVNSTVGRGSVGYDMSVVPPAAIERIEVLRDGAAAQYGSDAIAGVVNIVLKSGVHVGSFTTMHSQTTAGDGQTDIGSLSYGIPLGSSGGFLNGTLHYSDRAPTDRSGTYSNTVYEPRLPDARYFTPLSPAERASQQQDDVLVGVRHFDRNAMIVGNASSRSYSTFFNSALPVRAGFEMYGFGGFSRRAGRAAGFYRYPNVPQTRNLGIYPDGYLPFLETTIDDLTLAIGARRRDGDAWNVDLSSKYGRNSIELNVDHSLNPSLGALSPTRFYCGKLYFAQGTTNLDFSRSLEARVLQSLRVAFGAEYRRDRYLIGAGDEASWRDGNPSELPASQVLAAGAQMFEGFRPSDRTDSIRSSLAVYADVESDITKRLLLDAAARFEEYSDYGSSVSGKLDGRFTLLENLRLRGSINRGFRAPSLHQMYYSAVGSQFITVDGVNQQREVTTVRNDADITRRLGIPELGPEKSLSYSLGLAGSLGQALQITVDAYQIDIDDRIVLSGRFSDYVPQLAQYFAGTDVTDAQFFTNAVNTRTRGLDAILTYRGQLSHAGVFAVNAAYNHNRTRVTAIRTPLQLEGLGEMLLNREERGRLEVNQPRDKLILALNYSAGRADLHLQATHFGEITTIAPQDPAEDQTYPARLVTDIYFEYKPSDVLSLTFGANNIFDVYPAKVTDPRLTNDGTVPYSRFATQFGFNGASYFAKLELHF